MAGKYLSCTVLNYLPLKIPPCPQKEYLNLANKYEVERCSWSEYSEQKFCKMKEELDSLVLGDLSRETAVKVWQILETNGFQNGVFLKIARFNHSCRQVDVHCAVQGKVWSCQY